MYSDLYVRPHYQPSRFLVAAAIMVIVFVGIFYYTSGSLPTRASKTTITRHEMVNVTPKQVGIYWETDTIDEGWIIYGDAENNIKTIAGDTFTLKGEAPKRSYHYAELKNLNPETTYYYKIVSDNEMILSPQKKAFTVRTSSAVGSSGSLSPAYGKVAKSNGEVIKNAIVILTIPEAYPLLVITGNTGEWLVPLQYVVSRSKNSYLGISDNTMAQISIQYNKEHSKVNTILGKTHPLPQTLVLGENYTFMDPASVLSAQTEVQKPADNGNKIYTFDIRYPRNNSIVPGTAPLIKGYGIPGRTVTVSINSNPGFSATAMVDAEGQWSVPVSRSFLPGAYNLSAVSQNQNNRLVEIRHSYTLIKSGEQVLGENTSTPSATIKPSPTTRISTPTATPRIVTPTTGRLTPTVTQAPIPLTPTLAVTNPVTSVTPYVPTDSPTPPPPVSGVSNTAPYVMTGMGLMVVGAGLLLLL